METTTNTTADELTFKIVRTKTGGKVHRSVVYRGATGARAICGVRIACGSSITGGPLCSGCFNEHARTLAGAVVDAFKALAGVR